MPNIEIHGYGATIPSNPAKDDLKSWDDICPVYIVKAAFAAKEAIENVMKKIGLESDAKVTIFPSIARSCDGEDTESPFIRISNTKPEETKKIIDGLKEAEILTDIETMTLTGFIPAEEIRPAT